MSNKPIVNVIKVPLGHSPESRPQRFPRMPQLYLELIENKSKVKSELRDKEYIAPEQISEPTVQKAISDGGDQEEQQLPKRSASLTPPRITEEPEHVMNTEELEDSEHLPHTSPMLAGSDDESDILSSQLHSLLEEDPLPPETMHHDERSSDAPSPSKTNKYSRRRDENYNTISREPPPPLSKLRQRGIYSDSSGTPKKQHPQPASYPEIRTSRQEQEDEDAKRHLLLKFDSLKKSYPDLKHEIAEHSAYKSYGELQRNYDDSLRRLSLSSSVENYKSYLKCGFKAVEMAFMYFGVDMHGFADDQMSHMRSYERLLIELGEKSYTPESSKWPVEVRLLGLIMVNAVVFIGSRLFMEKMSGMFKPQNAPARSPSLSSHNIGRPQVNKPRMRGPRNINIASHASSEDET